MFVKISGAPMMINLDCFREVNCREQDGFFSVYAMDKDGNNTMLRTCNSYMEARKIIKDLTSAMEAGQAAYDLDR